MQTALQPQHPGGETAAECFGRIARTIPVASAAAPDLPARSANDADFRSQTDSAAAVRQTLAANSFAASALTRTGAYAHLSSPALDAAACSHRSAGLAATHRALFTDLADAVMGLYVRLRRRQRQRATFAALQALDDRTLSDVGLHRSEIESLAREIEDPAATRVFAVQSHRGHPFHAH